MSEQRPRQGEPEPVVIRDKRRVDRPGSDRAASGTPEPPEVARSGADAVEENVPKAEALLLEERTADLQRLQAEFANYRKRVERDRVLIGEQAVGGVLAALLPVLDDIDRARGHGDLTGGLKAVADQLDAVLTKVGLESFGDVGDPFDPVIHEAVMHNESDEVTEPTATTVMRRGYKHGERLLRPAMVGVTDPATPTPNNATQEGTTPPPADAPTEQASPAADATDTSEGE